MIALVEGQLDAISLESIGIPTYAVLGSSKLTGWQIGLIKRWTTNVLVYGDNDEAGIKASTAWHRQLSGMGCKVQIGPYLPSTNAKDPNDLVRKAPEYILKVKDSLL